MDKDILTDILYLIDDLIISIKGVVDPNEAECLKSKVSNILERLRD